MTVGLVDGLSHPLGGEVGLDVDVQKCFLRARGVGGDDHALQDAMGYTFHQVAVLEDAGLALLGVDHQVPRSPAGGPGALPLGAGGEVSPAPAAETGRLDLVDDLFGSHPEGAGQSGVASVDEILVDVGGRQPAAAVQGNSPLTGEEAGVRVLAGRCIA